MHDIYDGIEIVYRTILYFVLAGASGYMAYNSGLVFDGNFFAEVIIVWLWMMIQIGFIAYLMFVAKGSFRPKDKQEKMDTYHCFEYLQKLERM